MQKHKLPVSLTPAQTSWGIRYLLFSLVFLGPLLTLALYRIFPGMDAVYLDFLYFLINFTAIIAIFWSFLRASIRYTMRHIPRTLLAAAVGFAVYWVSNFVVSFVIQRLFPWFFNVNDASISATSQDHFWLMAIGTVLLVPLAEETLHRGLVFGVFHAKNRWLGYAISTLLFSAIHVIGYIGSYDPWMLLLCFAQYIPAGIALAWAYEYSGSIFAPILMHTVINAIGILSMR